MTEKQKRLMQLDALKNGIFSGVYKVKITHFDGRGIKTMTFEDEKDFNNAYNQAVKEYRHYAYVSRTIEFSIE